MKATKTNRKLVSITAPGVATDASAYGNEHLERIAVAAYYRAEARGFAPGQELDDWLTAEKEVSAPAGGI